MKTSNEITQFFADLAVNLDDCPHLPDRIVTYMTAAYSAGINPLPALRKSGYVADYCHDNVGPCNTEIAAGGKVHRMMITRRETL